MQQHLQDRLFVLGEAELRQVVDRLRLELEPRAELTELGAEPLVTEVVAGPQVDDRADVELAARDATDRALVLDDELALIDGKRARRTLRDEPAAQTLRLIRLEAACLGEHVDLVAVRRRGHPPHDVGDLARRDEIAGQCEPDGGVVGDR